MSTAANEIIELQSRVLFQDDVIQKLDAVIVAHGRRLDQLQQRINELEDKMAQLSFERDQPLMQENEKPPHY